MPVSTEPASAQSRIIENIQVLDLTRFLSGPQATLFLGVLGAEVIRIDEPYASDPTAAAPPFVGPEGVSPHRRTSHDIVIAYLKRSPATQAIMVNLKSEKGRALLFRLTKRTEASQHAMGAGSNADWTGDGDGTGQ